MREKIRLGHDHVHAAESKQQSDVKAGSFVIVLGTVDSKGVMHATRIDLRAAR